jgi:hypothetical protein
MSSASIINTISLETKAAEFELRISINAANDTALIIIANKSNFVVSSPKSSLNNR